MSHASPLFAAVVNLDQPGRYLHWSIFSVSVANLVLIAVMVVIFGLALLLPFPHGEREPEADPPGAETALTGTTSSSSNEWRGQPDNTMWTARLRRKALDVLPPDKLLPDRQPAYVSSWVYVFGVATLASLGMAIASGMVIALGGVDWWHTNPVGHFCNSLHLWSVELFMAFMVIHLWGKFWMAAWRGRRALTWMTGLVAFVASVVECFTGYLSQQNFDSQWISTNGKDAVNATGLGAFFNLMNFGQMLLWHVVLIPIVLVAIVGAHVLLVRVRGVSHPLPTRRPRGRAARRAAATADAADWRGPTRHYDIVKEAVIASVVALTLVVLLAGILSSPDTPPVTISSWATVAPADFMATSASELAGTSETASYGPPYNHGTAKVQRLGVSWQMLGGVRLPIDPAKAFVLTPLSKVAATDPSLARELRRYETAGAVQQHAWAHAYLQAVDHVVFRQGQPVVPRAPDGPVPALITTELNLARSGALDADLIAQHPFYGTNFTKPLLFLEDGNYFASRATAAHLTGTQWGVMNETGSYPGQPWLWLYTLWYQVPGFRTSPNVDLIAIYLTGAATIVLLGVPFIPGLRDIPSVVPVHRLIWRQHGSDPSGTGKPSADRRGPTGPTGGEEGEHHSGGQWAHGRDREP
ncbi:MAG: cytochrome b N-terminal domain-containing protein [Acidimicrobiales bacterium]